MGHNQIILSAKVSGVQDLIDVYRALADACDYPLHLGLTEAGLGSKGIVATTAALAPLLQEGIGDTIRASLTPAPGQTWIAHAIAIYGNNDGPFVVGFVADPVAGSVQFTFNTSRGADLNFAYWVYALPSA